MADSSEEVRVALLSCTNATGDALIANGVANINAFMLDVQNNPQHVVTNTLANMPVGQLQSLGNIAGMGNQPTTIQAFAKQKFSADFVALNSKISELGYLKAAQIAAGEAAIHAQYFVGTKADMPKFRDDVQAALTNAAGNVGFIQGHAAAKAAPAGAPAGADVHMG